MKNVFATVVFTFALLTALACSVAAQEPAASNDEQPKVVKAVAPEFYSSAARAVGAVGEVLVEVKINAAGEVSFTKARSGHPLLKTISTDAAKRWRFVSISGEKKQRTALLSFSYRIVDKKAAGVFFSPPYKVECVAEPHYIIDTVNSF